MKTSRLLRIGASVAILATLIVAMGLAIHASKGASAASPASGSYHYGPFAVTNDQDMGTCGNTWAVGSFNRSFNVHPKANVLFDETFSKGAFVTNAGASPQACASGTNNNNTVAAGVTGTFSGNYYSVVVSNGTYNPKAICSPTTCDTTAGFVHTVYGRHATYQINSYDFDYKTTENGGCTQDSSNLGGYYGDITGPVVSSSNPTRQHHTAPGL